MSGNTSIPEKVSLGFISEFPKHQLISHSFYTFSQICISRFIIYLMVYFRFTLTFLIYITSMNKQAKNPKNFGQLKFGYLNHGVHVPGIFSNSYLIFK